MIIKRSLRSSMPAPKRCTDLSNDEDKEDDKDDGHNVEHKPHKKRPRPDPFPLELRRYVSGDDVSRASMESSSTDESYCHGEVQSPVNRRPLLRARAQVLPKRHSDSLLIDTRNKERPNSKTLDPDLGGKGEDFSSLRPPSIELYEKEEEELYWACMKFNGKKHFPSRPRTHRHLPLTADVTVGPSSSGAHPAPSQPPAGPSPEATANSPPLDPEMDKLYREKKKFSDSFCASAQADPQRAETSAALTTRFQLGPVEVLPDTAKEIHRAYADIPEVDPIVAAGHEDVVFVDCLPSDERSLLPPQARDFARKRKISGPKAEEKYLQLKDQFVQRYQNAKAEILRRFPDQRKPPKSGRSGNNPNTKKPPKGMRVVVKWNEFGQPIGDWGNNFNNYLGCLAKRADLFNPYFMWVHQPFNRLEAAWRDLEKYFVMDGNPNAWNYIFVDKIPKMIQEFKTALKKTNFERYQHDWERFWYLDPRADRLHFAALCYYWETDAAKRKSDICKVNRAKNDIEHHGGSASFSQLEHKNKRPMRVDEIAKIVYGTFSSKYDKEEKKKKNLEFVDALSRSVQEATLQSQTQPQSDEESATAPELPVDVQDRCIQEVFGPNKKNRYRLRGVGARRLIQSSASSTTSVTEQSSAYEPGVSRKEFMEFKKNTEEMLHMRSKERELMISMASSMPPDQREKWMEKMVQLWGSSAGGSSGQKVGDDGPSPAQDNDDVQNFGGHAIVSRDEIEKRL